MKTIETLITVMPDGTIHLPAYPELRPGQHRAVLIVEQSDQLEAEKPGAPPRLLQLKMLTMPSWPQDARFHREDLYNDGSR